jgi:hypothetical protein
VRRTNSGRAVIRELDLLTRGLVVLISSDTHSRSLTIAVFLFHNVQAQTRILRQLAEEGEEFDEATLSRLSPYLTEHVNQFGKYTLKLDRDSPALEYTLELRRDLAPALATASV